MDEFMIALPWLETRSEFGRGGENKVRRPAQVTGAIKRHIPVTMRLIGHNRIDTALCQKSRRRMDDGIFFAGHRETIDDRPNPHVSKLFVTLHWRVERHRPTDVSGA